MTPSDRVPILVVDDDADIREAVRDQLNSAGYEVTIASSSDEALGLLGRGYRPAVMLIDYLMPGKTGVELLSACRRDPSLAGIPAIVMSGAAADGIGAVGIVFWLRKPFQGGELLDRVTRALVRGASGF